MRNIGRLSKNGSCHCAIISREAMRELGWSLHEPIVFFVEGGKLIISSLRAEVDKHHRSAAEIAARMENATV